jgi:hypothetical protein
MPKTIEIYVKKYCQLNINLQHREISFAFYLFVKLIAWYRSKSIVQLKQAIPCLNMRYKRKNQMLIGIILFMLPLHFIQAANLLSFQYGKYQTPKYGYQIKLDQWEISNSESGAKAFEIPFLVDKIDNVEIQSYFNFSDSLAQESVYLYSHGIEGAVIIYLNGERLYFQPAGNIPFQIQLPAKYLYFDKPNTISIQLFHPKSNADGAIIFPKILSPQKLLGIPRPLFIVVKNSIGIEFDHIHTSVHSNSQIEIAYRYRLFSQRNEEAIKPFSMEEKLIDRDGKTIVRRTITEAKNSIAGKFNIPKQNLWSVDDPVHIYWHISIKSGIYQGGIIQKKIYISHKRVQNNQYILNDSSITIRGIIYHRDYNKSHLQNRSQAILNDLIQIKKMGFNAVRFPHHIPDPVFFDYADSLGLLLFPELPLWRYPVSLFHNDLFLENTRNTLSHFHRAHQLNASVGGLSLGQQIPLHKPAVQKFLLLTNVTAKRLFDFPTYCSPIAGHPLPPDAITDFYSLEYCGSMRRFTSLFGKKNHQYLLSSIIGLDAQHHVKSIQNRQSNARLYSLMKEINITLQSLNLGGGFVESYKNWRVARPNYHSILFENQYFTPFGFVDENNVIKSWVTADIWQKSEETLVNDEVDDRRTNFFSILTFITTILFFIVYKKSRRFSENLKRSLMHSYGFFVDMRERRIIPLFNSIIMGLFVSFIFSIFISAVFYYFQKHFWVQEILSLAIPYEALYLGVIYHSVSPYKLVLFSFILFFLYPFAISAILKFIMLFTESRFRYRQSLAIIFWAAAPIIFMTPLSMGAYHLLLHFDIGVYIFIMLIVFAGWTHYRIMNGIRVLFVTKPFKVFMLMLLSYFLPFVIFWVVFKPFPNWYEYFKLILLSNALF